MPSHSRRPGTFRCTFVRQGVATRNRAATGEFFAHRPQVQPDFARIGIEDDPSAEALLERFGANPSEMPVAIWQGKDVLENPTDPIFARHLQELLGGQLGEICVTIAYSFQE